MNIFDTAADVEVEVEKDSVGYKAHESGLYPATIKTAYIQKNDETGSMTLVTIFNVRPENGDAFEFTERQCIVSGTTGGDFYIDKKTGKKRQLIGKGQMNSLCELLTGSDLSAMAQAGGVEPRTHKVRVGGQDTNRELPTIVAWEGLQLHIGLQKVIENKQEKQGKVYVNTAETRETNTINKYFDENLRTLNEKKDNEPAAHHVDWTKAYAGKTINKVKQVAAAGVPAGKPAQTLNLNI